MIVANIVDKYLGIDYIDNGRDPIVGLDCWGLIICVVKDVFSIVFPDLNYKKFGLLRNYVKSGKSGQPVFIGSKEDIIKDYDMSSWVIPVKTQPLLGDLILICPIENLAIHAGVYLKSGKFIHSITGQGVIVSEVSTWAKQIEGYYRIKPELISQVGY